MEIISEECRTCKQFAFVFISPAIRPSNLTQVFTFADDCTFAILRSHPRTARREPLQRRPRRRPRRLYAFSAKKDLLAQLLELNLAVPQRLEKAEPVTPPGIPATFPNPETLISDDCIRPPALK